MADVAACARYAVVWPAEERVTATAVCAAESGGNPHAHCLNCLGVAEDSRGLWQVNARVHTQFDAAALFDPAYNAQAAVQVWRAQGWRAWGAYTSGAYRAHLAAASAAVGTPSLADGGTVPPLEIRPEQAVPAVLLVAAAVAAYLLLA